RARSARRGVSSRAVKSSHRSRSHRRPISHVASAAALLLLCFVASCKTDTKEEKVKPADPRLLPGEVCGLENRPRLRRVSVPPSVVVAPGETRALRLTVEPDACEPNTARLVSADPSIAESPAEAKFDLRHASFDYYVRGGALGRTTISASMDSVDANGAPY